jgi:hypothetical protein
MAITRQKIVIGVLLLTLLSSGAIYITLQGQGVRIRVDEDKATFYIFNENSRWEVAGREYNRLFRGNTMQYRNVSGITIETREEGDYFIIQRKTPYRNGAIITDAFWFLTNVSQKELFPIAHMVSIENARGLLYRYSLDELEDIGPKRKLQGETFLTFGDNMKLVFPGNYRWAWVGWPYGTTDSFACQYDIPSDYEVFEFRFFDPPEKKALLLSEIADGTEKYWKKQKVKHEDCFPSEIIGEPDFCIESAVRDVSDFVTAEFEAEGDKWKLKLTLDAELCAGVAAATTEDDLRAIARDILNNESAWTYVAGIGMFPVETPSGVVYADLSDCEEEIEIELDNDDDGQVVELGFGTQVWSTSTDCTINTTRRYNEEIIANCDVSIEGGELHLYGGSGRLNMSGGYDVTIQSDGFFKMNESTDMGTNDGSDFDVDNYGAFNSSYAQPCFSGTDCNIRMQGNSITYDEHSYLGADYSDWIDYDGFINDNASLHLTNTSWQAITFDNDVTGRNWTVTDCQASNTLFTACVVTTDYGPQSITITDVYLRYPPINFETGTANQIIRGKTYRFTSGKTSVGGVNVYAYNTTSNSYTYIAGTAASPSHIYYENSEEDYMFIAASYQWGAFHSGNLGNDYSDTGIRWYLRGNMNMTGYWDIQDTTLTMYAEAGVRHRIFPVSFFTDSGVTDVGAGQTITMVNASGVVCDTETTDANGHVEELQTCDEGFVPAGYNTTIVWQNMDQHEIKVNGVVYASNITFFNDSYSTDAAGNMVGLRFDDVVVAPADNPPTNVNPVTPADGITNTTLYEEFNCTAEDDILLVNISILMNETGSWTENYTRTVTGTWNYSWLNQSFPDNTTILWGCRACDNSSQCTDNSVNRTVHFASAVGDTCDTCAIDCTEECTVGSNLACQASFSATGAGVVPVNAEINVTGTYANVSKACYLNFSDGGRFT